MNYDDLLRELKMEAVLFPDISAEDLADIIHALENHFCNATKDAVPVRHGHWIGDFCSECGKDALCDCDKYEIYGTIHSDYCPHCGAKMDEVGRNDTQI